MYERYLGALSAELPHACFSITKSYVSTLAASLVREGVLNDAAAVTHYVPELQGTAWEDATLREVMDMRINFTEPVEHGNENAGNRAYMRACGMRPRQRGTQNLYEYLRAVRKNGSHGGFAYKSVNTEVLAWVMARVTGRSLTRLLHERLWAPLGCEEDAHIIVDATGVPTAGGGLSATLRDLARFGELMRREGDCNGHQLVPASVVDDVRRGGDRAIVAKAEPCMPGYSYRNMWWVSHNELDAFEAIGIYGQRLHVAPEAEMVVARFASRPVAHGASNDMVTVPQLLALGRMLRS
ncbi:beta-lactamase family protein [Variovorax sp. LjRoot178]